MPNPTKNARPALTGTIAVRLSEDDRCALAAIAQRSDRTISYLVRVHLRDLLKNRRQAPV